MVTPWELAPESGRSTGARATTPSETSLQSQAAVPEVLTGQLHHISSLDGVRGIAVLSVMLFHFPFPPAANGIAQLLVRTTALGATGVDLFFVLSGFLITGVLLRSKRSPHYLRNFYGRRALRIFPVYYAVLAAYFLVAPLLNVSEIDWGEFFTFAFYLQGFQLTFSSTAVPLNHFWSLAVEEHFYLVWPFVVLLISRRYLVLAAGFAIFTAVLARIFFLGQGIGVGYFTLTRLDAIASGALVGIIFIDARPAGRNLRFGFVLLVLLAIPTAILYILFTGTANPVIQTVKYLFLDAIYAVSLVVILSCGVGSRIDRILSAMWLRTVGKFSYAMYVFHPFGFAAAFNLVARASWLQSQPAEFLASFGLAFGLTFATAWLSWQLYEQRFANFKRLLS